MQQELLGSSNKGEQVIIILLCLIGAVGIICVCMAGLTLLRRTFGKPGAVGDVSLEEVTTFQAARSRKIVAGISGVAMIFGAAAAGYKTWTWMVTNTAAEPVEVVPVQAAPLPAPKLVLPQATPIPAARASMQMPEFSPGEKYAAIRERLLAAGWSPFHAADAGACPEADTRCRDRPEMQRCTDAGMAPCEFAWKKEGKLLRVYTNGGLALLTGTTLVRDTSSTSAAIRQEDIIK